MVAHRHERDIFIVADCLPRLLAYLPHDRVERNPVFNDVVLDLGVLATVAAVFFRGWVVKPNAI